MLLNWIKKALATKSTKATDFVNTRGLSSTSWGRRIIAAEARGKFTNEDRHDAFDWSTCACSELPESLLARAADSPSDIRLRTLGVEFTSCVAFDDVRGAANYLFLIRDMASELLAHQRLTGE